MRRCKDCGSELFGRSDKLFCDDACRSNFHNGRLAEEKRLVYSINSILRKNRRLINAHLQTPMISKIQLKREGYNFSYYTHSKRMKGRKSYFCYDLGYREEGEFIQLIRDQEEI